MHGLWVFAADSTLDSGMGSTVYSDSHSSQQSVLYQSLLEPITIAAQQVCIRSIHTQVDHVHLDLLKQTFTQALYISVFGHILIGLHQQSYHACKFFLLILFFFMMVFAC